MGGDAMAQYMHLGVPVKTPQPKETYSPEMKLFLTDPKDHPYQYECLRFEPDSQMPEDIKNYPHVAYKVDNIEEELSCCEKIVLPVTSVDENTKIAFAWRDGILFELMQCNG